MARFYFILLLNILFQSCSTSENKETQANKMIVCQTAQTTDKAWYSTNIKAPLFNGLSGIDFKISTSSKEAQQYFNQGLMLSYGFNHAEAARSFYEATRLDSNCAMAYWGFAYVLGPNYNGGMEEDHFERAYQASITALNLSKNCTQKEKDLIKALTSRYVTQPPNDRSALDSAYASEMKEVYDRYPDDPEIGTLYAEALMNLHPWDLYEKDTKKPKSWTPQLVTLLEKLIQKFPEHPGAHHFYIHALEASETPEKALPSAALLDTLVPGAGHLVHMPSHIYINTGDYHLGSLSNIRAIEADSIYTTACHAQGVYPLTYYPHNYHFLAATATLEGNTAWAWLAAMKLQEHTAAGLMGQEGWGTLQHYYSIPYYIAVKLGMWDKILSFPMTEVDLVYPNAIGHYARGMAYLGKNNLEKAQFELENLNVLSNDSTLRNLTIWNINTTYDLVQIAVRVLSAGIALKQNKTDASISLLQEAVAIEDHLNYNEPPDWFFSVRHHLGAVLIESKNYKEAEQVYRRDLQIWKKNGWALIGLYNALKLQKKDREAKIAKSDFDKAWQYADIRITSSSSLTR